MDIDWKVILSKTGEYVGLATQKTISFLSSIGTSVTVTQAKVINLVIFLIGLYLLIKVIEVPKKMIKWAIIILLIFLGASTIFSFI